MEQTLGKRIIENRKRLGLTQDRLAEQLGVTAQAVSKWENDQSCPDITMLPKLAEIFGITTDALLGIEQPEKVHVGEVVTEESSKGIHLDHNDGTWEFHYDGGRKPGIGFAIWVLLVGGLLLASNLLNWHADVWDIAWPSAIFMFGLWGLFPKFSFFRMGCFLFGGYYLLNNLELLPYHLGKELILPILLLLFGLNTLVDSLKNKKKPGFTITHDGKTVHSGKRKFTTDYEESGETFDCSLAFGNDSHRIGLSRFSSGSIDVSFGELTVDLTGVEEFAERSFLNADCAFGNLVIRIPKFCKVEPSTDTAFASVTFQGDPDPNPVSILKMDCDVAFGQVQIQYI